MQWLPWACLAGAICHGVAAAEPPVQPVQTDANGQAVSFRRDVAPILARRCLSCHSQEKAKGGYTLHTPRAMLKPGESRLASVVPGKPAESHLYKLLVTDDEDERMPQRGEPLDARQIGIIERWIRDGAKLDEDLDDQTPLTSLVAGVHPPAPQRYARPFPIRALAFRPDGKEIAAGGHHEITIWDPADGRLVARLGSVDQQTHALAYSPDGRLLVAAGGTPGVSGELKLFDAERRVEVTTLDRIGEIFLDVRFSPDGRRIAAAGGDNAVRVYDAATFKRELLSEQHADWVTALAFSPDGKTLVTASRDKTVRIIDARGGDVQATYADHDDAPLAVAIDAKGKLIYSGGRDRAVHAWEAEDAKKAGRLEGIGGEVLELLAFQNHLFAATTDRKVRQYRLDERSLVRELPHDDWVYSLTIDRDAKRLATGGFNGEVRVYDVADGRLLKAFIAAPGYGATD